MVPTKERNHSAILVRHKNEGILLDCGEGTQRQLKIAEKYFKESLTTFQDIKDIHGKRLTY